MDPALMMRMQQSQHQSQELQEKLQVVEQQINELEVFKQALEDLEKSTNNEMLASLGKGVFIKTAVTDDKFFVDVGSGVFVRKNSEETKAVVTQQVARLQEMRVQLITENETLNEQLQQLITEAESVQASA